MSQSKIKLLFVFGTRPEALKLAPVVLAAKKDRRFSTRVCLTGQHREMVDQVLKLFTIRPDDDLDLMRHDQSLGDLTQRIFQTMEKTLRKNHPDFVIVQGDTTTAFSVALKAFYEKIPVVHVEAGLRSHDKYQPFPEEMNRVLISRIADYHFTPTLEASGNLLREGIAKNKIFLTGNTIIDALHQIKTKTKKKLPIDPKKLAGKKMILMTAHRRENFGKPLEDICDAILTLTKRFPELAVVYPVHLNPRVRDIVKRKLSGHKQIFLLPPVSYLEIIALMDKSHLILTDSGGIQEEAPTFHKPVLVLREVTERPDGVKLGVARLVGTSKKKIVSEVTHLLKNPKAYQAMASRRNPYGDGCASQRILNTLAGSR